MFSLFLIISLSIFIAQDFNPCYSENNLNRSIYSIGDTLSVDDQNRQFQVCNGSNGYDTGDNFSFSDFNGNQNNGDYKITLISMNATW